MKNRLSALQLKVLRTLAVLEPPWTLVGGGALLALGFVDRPTRDVDLFFRGRAELLELTPRVVELLSEGHMRVDVLQRGKAFVRLQVTEGDERSIVDLVADPTTPITQDELVDIDGQRVLVCSARESLANKLCALLSRSEIRDLADVEALIASGLALSQSLIDAAALDAGFSPLTLVWVLESFDAVRLADGAALSASEAEHLDAFRQRLIKDILVLAKPA